MTTSETSVIFAEYEVLTIVMAYALPCCDAHFVLYSLGLS